MRPISSLLFFWLLHALTLHGQQPYVQVISEEKKFGQGSITTIMEDHQGILWIGSHLGLIRFDGIETTIYRPEKGSNNSISNEFVYSLFEDKAHNIWIATRNGLSRLDPLRKTFTRYFMDSEDPSTLPNNRIFGLLPDSDSTILLICDNSELSSLHIRSGKVSRLNPPLKSSLQHSSDPDLVALRAIRTSNGKVIVFTRSGMFEYRRAENELRVVQDTLTQYDTISNKGYHFLSNTGALWFAGAGNKLYKWVPYQSLQQWDGPFGNQIVGQGILTIQDFDDRHVLVSTRGDYLKVPKEGGSIKPLRFRADQEYLLKSTTQQWDQINACLETREGIVVMGTVKGELLMINPLLQQFGFKNILDSQSSFEAQIQSPVGDCLEDAFYRKRYITLIHDSCFYVENLVDGTISRHGKKHVSGMEAKWLLDQKGRLWLCNGPVVLEVNRKDHSIRSWAPETSAQNLFEMVEVSPGRFMVGSFREGLYWFEPDKHLFQIITETRGWIRSQVFSMIMDKDHQFVWIGTVRNGLFRYDIADNSFVHFEYDSHNPYSMHGDWVRDIAIDSTGDVWFAADPTGLSRYRYNAHPDSAFLNLSMQDGLPSNFIAGLGVDAKGFIWMTSLNGIARLDPASFDIKLYGKGDGLPSPRFNRANFTMTKGGVGITGSQSGYIYFRTDSLITNRKPPTLILRDFMVFNQSRLEMNPDNRMVPLQLTYKENFITIQFSVVNYTEPDKNTVRYMIEGLDEQWNIRTGISQVSYTNIPPGEYTFRILAANNDGVWNPKEMVVPFEIRPPFWQRTWFYIMVFALLSAFIGFLYKYRLTQSIKQNRLVTEKETLRAETEKKLAQLEMTALRAQMNPHFIFNCLNSINRFIIVNDNDAASEYLTKFSKLIRQVLDNSRGEKISLATELETLRLYIEMESLRFADRFEYSFEIDPGIKTEQYLLQPMLIQPYVENAIWHGLMHRKSKGQLLLRFSGKGQTLYVEIEDNGVGRVMAREIKAAQLVHKSSHGMKVTAERMSLLSRKLQVPVEARVEDLYDEHQQACGTRVSLTLPLEWQSTAQESPKPSTS